MDPLVAAALVAAVVLGGLWVAHLRRDVARRAARGSEWTGQGEGGQNLWTSSVRCIECHASGAVISRERGQLWHTCMACGARHARDIQA
ncbi:hypothetical protein [Euzebya pacifica]|jgi:hypothetical protein|uniref:hypothetical protein n=1 Tax=Euzebya pacifica TaxID=1608957 RepID=UPI0030F64DC0